jgi:hypothetical protein
LKEELKSRKKNFFYFVIVSWKRTSVCKKALTP